ncbi:MAG: type II secretion system F family protein, partial [Candidatus Niyogibacteria bacterium]|nr:type II secretion system F family protein [Candidatus Niyogibacteria bacterium]
MPVFYFRAKNLSGAEIEGRREAADRYELAANLKKEGYFLIGQKEETKKESVLKFVSILRRVSIQEKMMFARNLGVMAGAGVSLIRGLDVLSRQTGNSVWRDTLQKLAQAIKKGQTLSQSMEDYPKFFSPLFRSMVKAGEVSGKLEEALRLMAQQLE